MSTAIRCSHLFDGSGTATVRDAAVLIDGDRIVGAGLVAAVSIPESAHVVDLAGCTVLPGLIDMHGHMGFVSGRGSPREQMQQTLDRLVLNGVVNSLGKLREGITTARELGNRGFVDVTVRDGVREGLIPGPTWILATRALRATHGHGAVATPVDGAVDIRAAIRENITRGAEFVKIFVSGSSVGNAPLATRCFYTLEEIQAAVDDAHSAGMPISAHCEGGIGLSYCLETGVDYIEHAAFLSDEHLELMLKKGTSTIVFTMGHIAQVRPEALPPGQREWYRTAMEAGASAFRKVREAGGRWLVGTDNGKMVSDLEVLVRYGVSPMEALATVTSRAASALGMGGEVGIVEPGKRADLIAVRGDPLADIGAMRSVAQVIKAGEVCALGVA